MLALALMSLVVMSAYAQKVECSVGSKNYKIEGRISNDTWNKAQSSKVTFTGIPANLEEFKQVRQTLGKEPQGAVALQVMAFEMYRRDRAVGEQALKSASGLWLSRENPIDGRPFRHPSNTAPIVPL